jgi:hypothetical protein
MKLAQMYIFPLTLLSVLFIVSCSRTPTQPSDSTFSLTVADASCREVYLQLRLGSGITSREVTLKRDTVVLFTRTITGTETALTDTSLLPNRTYAYTASVGGNTEHCTATTMDTTSHSFSFTRTSLGDGTGSSTLFDVAIINDTLAYAVGQMFINDSTGQVDPQPYNVAIWNGKAWRIQKVPYVYQGQPFYHPIQCIYAFGTNDMWLAGNGVQHWDGQRYVEIDLPISLWGQNQVNKIWGVNSNDLYVVGNSGSIAHYNGSTWTKIESGTTLDVVDIYGSTNPSTGKQEILAVASQLGVSLDRRIFEINQTTATALSDYPITQPMSGIWFVPERHYYVTGSGTYEKRNLSDNAWTLHSANLTTYYTDEVRGNGLNDVMVVGAFGEILHFNGTSWQSYRSQTALSNGAYGGIALKGNLVITVGHDGPQAVITMGRR